MRHTRPSPGILGRCRLVRVSVAVVVGLTTAGCGGGAGQSTLPGSVVAPPSLADSSWLGACTHGAVGTYTFRFGPETTGAGRVQVEVPDMPGAPHDVPYRATTAADGTSQLEIDLNPTWRGQFTRDQGGLVWSFTIDRSPIVHTCQLTSP